MSAMCQFIMEVASSDGVTSDLILCAFVFFAGLGMAVLPNFKRFIKTIKYVPVNAKCVGLSKRINSTEDGSSEVFAPIWHFKLGDKTYQTKEKYYSRLDLPTVRREYELYVNPKNPKQTYRYKPQTAFNLKIAGIIVIVLSLILYAYLTA